jgi:hypothetical protein
MVASPHAELVSAMTTPEVHALSVAVLSRTAIPATRSAQIRIDDTQNAGFWNRQFSPPKPPWRF